jgi:hypothetical protein
MAVDSSRGFVPVSKGRKKEDWMLPHLKFCMNLKLASSHHS